MWQIMLKKFLTIFQIELPLIDLFAKAKEKFKKNCVSPTAILHWLHGEKYYVFHKSGVCALDQ